MYGPCISASFRACLISCTMFSTVCSLFVILLYPFPNGSITTTLFFFASSLIKGSKSRVGAAVPALFNNTMVLTPSPFV